MFRTFVILSVLVLPSASLIAGKTTAEIRSNVEKLYMEYFFGRTLSPAVLQEFILKLDTKEEDLIVNRLILEGVLERIVKDRPTCAKESLIKAIEHRDLASWVWFLATNPRVMSERDEGALPLNETIRSNQVALARLMLLLGADPNAVDQFGDTPMLVAARHLNWEAVRVLRRYGADVNSRDHKNRTPLFIAQQRSRMIRTIPHHQVQSEMNESFGRDAIASDQAPAGRHGRQRSQSEPPRLDLLRTIIDAISPRKEKLS